MPQPTITRSSSWKWWITGLLLLATTINYVDRVTLGNASVKMTRELGLSDSEYGKVELAFGWSFAAGSCAFGFLSDRVGIFGLYPAILAAWSLVGIATGFSHGYGELLVCRGLLGFFEAGHWPCALKTTYALLDEKDRTMGNSVLQSGASIGAIFAPQIVKVMMTDEPGSWRKPFIVVGAVGLIWVLFWFLSLRPRDLKSASPALAASADQPKMCQILASPSFWAVALLIVGVQLPWHLFRVWLQKFLETGRHYDRSVALNFNSVFYIATDVGCILAGIASLWLAKAFGLSAHRSRRVVYAGACVLTSLSVLIPFLPKGYALLGVLLLIGAGALALFPCYYSFVQELSPSHVGRMTGLLSMWVWAVTSPIQPLFGKWADKTGSYDAGLLLAGLAPWIGVVSMALLWKPARAATSPPAA